MHSQSRSDYLLGLGIVVLALVVSLAATGFARTVLPFDDFAARTPGKAALVVVFNMTFALVFVGYYWRRKRPKQAEK